MTPRQWQNLLKRLERRQTVQSVADLKKISKNIRTLRAEIAGSLATWEALASQGDRTGLMMAAHLKRMTGNLDRIMGNASQALNHDLEKSWQKWWAMGGESTLQMAKAGGMAVTELAMAADKLNLYQNYIPDLIKSVADQTKTKMANFVRTAALAGTPRNEVQKGMLQILLGEPARFDRGRFGGFAYQVERIYRTESQRLYNMAGQQAAETLMETTGADLVKVWNHPGADDTARPDHVDMDGETVEVDEPFSNGLMYPKDPAGSAEDTINCRCWASYVPREKQAGDEVDKAVEPEPEPEPVAAPAPAPEPAPVLDGWTAVDFATTAAARVEAARAEAAAADVAFADAQRAYTPLLRDSADPVAREAAKRRYMEAGTARAEAHKARVGIERRTLLERFPEGDTKVWTNVDDPKMSAARIKSVDEGTAFVERLSSKALGTGELEVTVYETEQASSFYRSWGSEQGVHLSKYTDNATRSTIHELGHALEHNVPGLHAKVEAFYKSRTKGEVLKASAKGYPYTDDKWGLMGKRGAYAGRWYGPAKAGAEAANYKMTSSEIVSMGLEHLFTDPLKFAQTDPEYFDFIMSLLQAAGGGP